MHVKRISAAIAVLLCTLPACSTVSDVASSKIAPTEQQAPLAQPVEKVNGVAITRAELDRTVKSLLAQNGVTQQLTPEKMKQAEEIALNQLTSAELLYQAASKVQVPDLDRLVTETLAQEQAKFADQAAFEKALQVTGMTPEEMREITRRQVVINHFVENTFVPKETASEAEAKKFYDDNLQKYFKKGERVRASHILVGADKKAAPEEKTKAREKAEALLKRVQGGEDFAAVAKKESSCPSSARGGDLGVFGRGEMSPYFEKAAFALNVGELSAVVETPFGYHVIRVEEKLAPSTEKFEDLKDKIVHFLRAEKVKKAVSAYVAELRTKAKIEKV